jgi:ZIP family zinc transporter
MIELSVILMAFALTLFAGLATGIGSFIAFFTKQTNTKLLSFALGLSAGVMIYVSFVDLFPESSSLLIAGLGDILGSYATVLAFFAGVIVIVVIDRLIPSYENPHEIHRVEEMDKLTPLKCKNLMRVGILVALAITIHNFPEGIATFASALVDLRIGISIAIAVAIHNIPEGIAVSMPIFCATGNRKKAFVYSFLTGLAEPLGALIGFVVLFPFMNDAVLGILLAAVAGIMVFISLDQLLPAAREYGHHHLSVYGLIFGMGIMALSLLLFM